MADLSFDEFVTTRSAAFLRLAYALTRDHAHAEDLLQTALANTWPAWKRISGDPEPYVRRALINTHRSWWRRRWHGEQPTEPLPEIRTDSPQSTVDERDAIWRALRRLPERQRAVLILKFIEDLSEAQIAEVLGIAPGTVKSYTAKGLAQLRADPGLLDIPPGPAGVERLVGVKKHITQRRRNRIITVAAVIAVVIAVLIGTSPLLRNRSLEPLTPFPEYQMGHRIVASAQFRFPEGAARFTWTPRSLPAILFPECDHDTRGVAVFLDIEINGTRMGGRECPHARMSGFTWRPVTEQELSAIGVQIGQPTEVRISIDTLTATMPQRGTARLAIGEPAAWEGYPFPKRPAQLKQLNREGIGPPETRTMLDASRQSMTVDRGREYLFNARSQTPGRLHFHLNGELAATLSWWDYNDQLYPLNQVELPWDRLGPSATTATLTVTPEAMTGDWFVEVSPINR